MKKILLKKISIILNVFLVIVLFWQAYKASGYDKNNQVILENAPKQTVGDYDKNDQVILENAPKQTVCDIIVQEKQKTEIEAYTGEPAPVNFDSNPDAKLFRTTITSQVAEGANFAGHYTVATWGCGTSCIGYAIVDVLTGNIVDYAPRYPDQTITGFGLSIDKNILVFNPEVPTDKDGYQSNGYKEERTIKEIVEEDYEAGFGRVYYDLLEYTNGTKPSLRKLCTENIYSDLVK